jgi:hypothetical protein
MEQKTFKVVPEGKDHNIGDRNCPSYYRDTGRSTTHGPAPRNPVPHGGSCNGLYHYERITKEHGSTLVPYRCDVCDDHWPA